VISFFKFEQIVRFNSEMFMEKIYTVVSRFLIAQKPLADGCLIDAENIRKFLLTEFVFRHYFFYDFYIWISHDMIICNFRSQVIN